MVSRQESGTLGEGRPGRKSSVWPPWIELMFMVERRAPSGTTGMRVRLRSSAGNSSSSKAASTAPMWRTAQSPRNGIEPCAISPLVSISAHQTPRWPRQMRSLLSGSGMMTWSTLRLREIALARQIGDAAEAAGFLVGRAGNLDRAGKIRIDLHEGFDRDDRCGQPALHVAGAAAIDPAVADDAGERIDAPALAGLDHVDMRVEMHGRRPAQRPSKRATTLVRGIAVGVAGRAFAAHELDAEAALRQPRAEIFGAGRDRPRRAG